MARKERVVFTCDRCGAEFDPPATPQTGPSRPVVLHEAPLFTSGRANGTVVSDLCGACGDALRVFMAGGKVIDVSGLSETAQKLLGGFGRGTSTGPADTVVTVSAPPPIGSVGQALLDAQRRSRHE